VKENPFAQARSLVRRLVGSDGSEAMRALRKDLLRVMTRLDRLEETQRGAAELLQRVDRTATQLRLVSVLNRRQQSDVARLPAVLDEQRIAAHVRRAAAAAPLLTDPYEHIVVERVLPDDVYDLLIRAIPPGEFFNDRDRIKQNLAFPMELAPTLSACAWEYMDEVIARRVIRPVVLEKFHEPLQRHFASLFGPGFVERANALPQSVHGGRLMLRRPGYHLGPHRDPKHAMLTCLLYLARDGDSAAYGTQIFRVRDDAEAGYKQTYYPEEDGHACELVKVVPFKPNTMLVSLNSEGAHGATIPTDAPADLERYTYQFYVAPQKEAFAALLKSLPAARRATWSSKPHAQAASAPPMDRGQRI
jgi:hypothetical protein